MPTPDVEYAQLDGRRVAYRTIGSGRPVVLIHGSFATSSAWKRLVAHLDPLTWCAIALDLPGWGASDALPAHHHALVDYEAEAVEAVCRQVTKEPIHLVGHSHGGVVALAVALTKRVHVSALTLFEPLPMAMLANTSDQTVFDEVKMFVTDYRRRFELGDQWAARGVIDLWGGKGAFDAMSASVRTIIAAGTAQNLRHWAGNFAFRPPLEALRQLDAPTALVRGALANDIAKLLVRRLNEAITHSVVTEIEGASHFMIHTHASESARALRQA